MRYHLTPVRIATINKSTNSKCWWACGEKGTLVHSWWNAVWCSHCGKQYGIFSKKLKMELPFDPVIPLLGIYPKDPETPIQKICTPMFIAALFTIAKIWKQPKCPWVDEWIKEKLHIFDAMTNNISPPQFSICGCLCKYNSLLIFISSKLAKLSSILRIL